ncbi:cadherin repeat domain-containing protein [Vibrio fluvialis]|uniref:cadherin repeat domain-containing protein n=1 Tax=Vibrio fluvialis TaxID=676 RepID=UPI001EEABB49|nr:cadherin repeat domain-containing protein [Vibrio fluvialis]MCG6350022.1 cadherin repeat domain-containing protein [Vibrio fluvialis]
MDTRTLTPFMLANVTLVIDRNGQFREQAAGTPLRPGEVVVQVSDDASPQVTAELVNPGNAAPTNLDGEIAQILQQIQQGADPTQNPELATAAGGQNGSSPTATGSVDRTGDEVLAATNFETQGLQGLGLSSTQSLALTDFVAEIAVVDTPPAFNPNDPENVNGPRYSFSYDENRSDGDVIGVVQATDAEGEGVTYAITTNVFDSNGNTLFEIDEVTGEISLTPAGVVAFSNDFEQAPNVHDIIVTATEVDGLGVQNSTSILVELSELNLDEFGPVFDPNDPDKEDGPRYVFSYDDNSSDEYVIGTVSATDGDGEAVTYSITTNVYNDANEALFEIDAVSGAISLTAAGVTALSNDYETHPNVHDIVVTATEVAGLGEQKSTDITVDLSELNLDEFGPVFEPNDPDNEAGPRYVFSYDENSSDEYVIGTVSATDGDGEAVTYSITTNVYNDANEALFEIDAVNGAISLTAAGVTAFSNDFEDTPNVHTIQVMATEVEGLGEQKSTVIDVQLTELNLDDNAPIFDDEYIFTYEEDSEESDLIGTVSATDADGENVTYSIKTNVYDSNNNPLFWINATTGAIYLTSFGVLAFTNDFEQESNIHNLVVTATEVDGLGAMKSTDVDVVLKELNVNEPPVAEDFTVLLGEGSTVSIIFDSDVESKDHIYDVDDDATGTPLHIVLVTLPEHGVLMYTDEQGHTRALSSADLYSSGSTPVLLNPNNIVYVSDENASGSCSTWHGESINNGYGYQIELNNNGSYAYISATKALGNGTVVAAVVDVLDHHIQGTGFSVGGGNGINNNETLSIDLSSQPSHLVTFGVDGLNPHHSAVVTYVFSDGTSSTILYSENDTQFEFQSDKEIVEVNFTASAVFGVGGTGANYVVSYISFGAHDSTTQEDDSFEYRAIDSDGLVSDVATVTLDNYEDTGHPCDCSSHIIAAQVGNVNAVIIGEGCGGNVFAWLDGALDNSTDTVKNFTFGVDKLDLSAVISDGENCDSLLSKINVVIDNDNVKLSIEHSGGVQTIVIENGVDIFDIAGGLNPDTTESLLNQILKTETV